MRHHNTRAIAQYWDSLKQGQDAPARDDLSPQELSDLLANVFILQRLDADHAVFRLAGTGLCTLYQREFREQNFLGLWRGADRIHMGALLAAAAVAPAPALALAEAETIDGLRLKAEIFVAPLADRSGDVDRFLGLYQPLGETPDLQGRPLVRQHVVALYPPNANAVKIARRVSQREQGEEPAPAAAPAPHLRLVADNTRADLGGSASAFS